MVMMMGMCVTNMHVFENTWVWLSAVSRAWCMNITQHVTQQYINTLILYCLVVCMLQCVATFLLQVRM